MANKIKTAPVNYKTSVTRVKKHTIKGTNPFGRQPKNI